MYKWVDLHTHLEWWIPFTYYRLSSQKELISRKLSSNMCWLEDFSHVFWLLSRTIKNEEDYRVVTKNFLIQQKENGAFYTEFRLSPYHHVFLWGKKIDKILHYVRKWIDDAFEETWSIWKIIIESARQYGLKHMQQVFDRSKYHFDKEYLVGFWVWWVEEDSDLETFTAIFDQALNLKIPLTIHAGENSCVDNLQYCIRHPWILRIGHALSYNLLDPEMKNTLKESWKTIEVCLSSNNKLKYVNSLDDHPLIDMHRKGIKYCISTDDTTIFQTTYSDEIQLAQKLLGLKMTDMSILGKNAVDSAFCSLECKNFLWKI